MSTVDLSTRYLGLKLKNPLVASSSPLSRDADRIRQLEDAGASAIVLHSLFEEQINIEANELDRNIWGTLDISAEGQSYYPDFHHFNFGPEKYLEHIRKAKQVVKVPIIASLNGVSRGGWTRYAKEMEQAGADALELNIYFIPTDVNTSGADLEKMYLELVKAIVSNVKVPVAVKIGPYFSSIGNMALQIAQAGAQGLVLFNRFYQPDYNLEKMEVEPRLHLSRSDELTLRLHWAAILFDRVKVDLAITGGVHAAEDVVKAMCAGGRVAMMTSALLQHGVGYLKAVEINLRNWLERNEYESIEQMQGSLSYKKIAHPAAYERANYMKVLGSYHE